MTTQPPLAVEIFCETAARLSVLAVTLGDCIHEADINPLQLTGDSCLGLTHWWFPPTPVPGRPPKWPFRLLYDHLIIWSIISGEQAGRFDQ